ncbi:hypothetical protein BC938DRAFT_471527, partial [Jimgerdemannia flammicorona]
FIELNGVEILPPDFDASRKYPVLFRVYGGPGSQMVSHRFQLDWSSFVASNKGLSYIVVMVDGRGTGFKGRKFKVAVRGRLGELETIDQVNAGRHWASLDYVDPTRMAIWGWVCGLSRVLKFASYGGYMTSKVVEANDGVFTTAMAVAPVTDWIFYGRFLVWLRISELCLHWFTSLSHPVHFQNSAVLVDMLTQGSIRGYRTQFYTDNDHSINTDNANREIYHLLTTFLWESFGGEHFQRDQAEMRQFGHHHKRDIRPSHRRPNSSDQTKLQPIPRRPIPAAPMERHNLLPSGGIHRCAGAPPCDLRTRLMIFREHCNSSFRPHVKRHDMSLLNQTDFEIGQLVHLESFSLYEAMSAIEIMDPKMDTGMVLKDGTHRVFDPSARLSEQEVIFVIDRFLCCEVGMKAQLTLKERSRSLILNLGQSPTPEYQMTWLTGQSLSQTIFTCLYCHHVFSLTPESLTAEKTQDDPAPQLVYLVLKGYIVATVKCCMLIWREMIKGNIYEEEDFTVSLFGLSLQENYLESDVLNVLEDAMTWLEEVKKQQQATDSTRHLDALLDRLRLRRSYLLALIHLSKPNCVEYSEARRELARASDYLRDGVIGDTMEEGVEVEGAFDPNINRKLAAHTPPRPITLLANKQALDNLGGLINRLESICKVVEFTSVGSLLNFIVFFAAQKPAPCAFSRSKLNVRATLDFASPPATPLPSTFYSELRVAGTRPISWLVRDAVLDFSRPPTWWFGIGRDKPPDSSSNEQQYMEVKELVNRFLDRAARPFKVRMFVSCLQSFIDNVKTQCHNRARLRRMLCKLLNDWESLQDEAEQMDAQLHMLAKIDPVVLGLDTTNGEASYPYYLSSWVFHQKLAMMEEVLFLGFELELYGAHEYLMVYWYLDYVLQCHYQHFERVAAHTEAAEQFAMAKTVRPVTQVAQGSCEFVSINNGFSADTRKSKKYKKPKAPSILSHASNSNKTDDASSSEPLPAMPEIIPLQMLNVARQELCRGIYRAILGFAKTDHLRQPLLRFDHEPTRFAHRFKMFAKLISPAWLKYEDFAKSADTTDIEAPDLLLAAQQNFQTAKSTLEGLISMKSSDLRTDFCHAEFTKDMQALARTCIANNIAIQVVGRDVARERKVKMEFKFHHWYPVFTIV